MLPEVRDGAGSTNCSDSGANGKAVPPSPHGAIPEGMDTWMNEPDSVWRLAGTLNLFGFPPRHAALEVLPRSRGWRVLRASGFFGAGLVLAPVVGVVPPHAPWVAAALGIGGFLGIRKWRERFTLVSFQGNCPRCGEAVRIRAGIPVRPVLSVPCEACHFDTRLEVALPAATPGTRYRSAPPLPEQGAEKGGAP